MSTTFSVWARRRAAGPWAAARRRADRAAGAAAATSSSAASVATKSARWSAACSASRCAVGIAVHLLVERRQARAEVRDAIDAALEHVRRGLLRAELGLEPGDELLLRRELDLRAVRRASRLRSSPLRARAGLARRSVCDCAVCTRLRARCATSASRLLARASCARPTTALRSCSAHAQLSSQRSSAASARRALVELVDALRVAFADGELADRGSCAISACSASMLSSRRLMPRSSDSMWR